MILHRTVAVDLSGRSAIAADIRSGIRSGISSRCDDDRAAYVADRDQPGGRQRMPAPTGTRIELAAVRVRPGNTTVTDTG